MGVTYYTTAHPDSFILQNNFQWHHSSIVNTVISHLWALPHSFPPSPHPRPPTGVVGACHSVDVGTLQAMLTEHLDLDISLTPESHTIIRTGGRSHTSFDHWGYCLLGLLSSLSSLSSADELRHVVVGACVELVQSHFPLWELPHFPLHPLVELVQSSGLLHNWSQ